MVGGGTAEKLSPRPKAIPPFGKRPYASGMVEHLVTGDRLPSLFGNDLEGKEVDITASVAGKWGVLLFYRGDW